MSMGGPAFFPLGLFLREYGCVSSREVNELQARPLRFRLTGEAGATRWTESIDQPLKAGISFLRNCHTQFIIYNHAKEVASAAQYLYISEFCGLSNIFVANSARYCAYTQHELGCLLRCLKVVSEK